MNYKMLLNAFIGISLFTYSTAGYSITCDRAFLVEKYNLTSSIFSGVTKTFGGIAKNMNIHITGESGYAKKLEMIENARPGSTIDMAYFIFENDYSSSFLVTKLLKAAQEKNIKIRLLVDYTMSSKYLDFLSYLNSHTNVQVKRFRPPTNEFRTLLLEKFEISKVDLFLKGLSEQNLNYVREALMSSGFVLKNALSVQKLLANAKSPEIALAEFAKSIAASNSNLAKEFLYHLTIFTKRMHHKLMLADSNQGLEFLVGGRNISDEYHLSLGHAFLEGRNYPFFDSEVSGVLSKENRKQMKTSFEDLWTSELSVAIQSQKKDIEIEIANQLRIKSTAFEHQINTLNAAVKLGTLNINSKEIAYLENGPQHKLGAKDISRGWIEMINNAKTKVEIISAYMYLTPELHQAIKSAAQRGVQVIIRTNSFTSTDMNQVNIGFYASFEKVSKDLGPNVKFYELQKGPKEGSLHIKSIIVDNKAIGIGSANTDPRTQWHDTNNLVLINTDSDSSLTQQFSTHYNQAGINKLTWFELTPQIADSILAKVKEKNPAVLQLVNSPWVLQQL